MKNLLSLLLMLCLSVPGFAQANKAGTVAKALTQPTKKLVASNLSSKVYKANYALTTETLNAFKQIYTQQVAAVLLEKNFTDAVRMQVLDQLKKQSAENLAKLQAQMEKEYAQWADAALRERNPRFLPKKDSSIPGLLAISPDPKKYPHITIRFYREWLDTIPEYEGLPDGFSLLLDGLKKRLDSLDADMKTQYNIFVKAKKQLHEQDSFEMQRFYRKQMKTASRNLVRLSKEAAQSVSDVVYMLKQYPSLFQNSLTLLAKKIATSLKTEFNAYLSEKLQIKVTLKSNAPNAVGFVKRAEEKPLEIPTGQTFTGHK